MTTIAAGTPVIVAAGGEAAVVGLTPHQPAGGFANADAAVEWRQAQLWFDRSFEHARPRAATAVAQAGEGFALLDLDRSLRVRGGNHNVPVGGWAPLDDRVVAVVDGHGVRLPRMQPNAIGDAAAGAMLAARPGAPAHVALDGADPAAAAARVMRMPSKATLGLIGAGVLLAGGVTAAVIAKTTGDD